MLPFRSANRAKQDRVGLFAAFDGSLRQGSALTIDGDTADVVLAGGNVQQLTEAALRSGVRDLRRSALDKVKQGVTSLVEINRVTKD